MDALLGRAPSSCWAGGGGPLGWGSGHWTRSPVQAV